MTVEWFPEGLNAAIVRGVQASFGLAEADAIATSPSKKAGAIIEPTSPTSAVLHPTGIGDIFEEGASPHEESGSHGYLYLGGGRFVSGTIHHPGMAPRPYLAAAGERWANGEAQAAMSVSVRGAGFL